MRGYALYSASESSGVSVRNISGRRTLGNMRNTSKKGLSDAEDKVEVDWAAEAEYQAVLWRDILN